MAKLFGFSIDDGDKKPKGLVSPVPQNNEDGVDYYLSSGFYGGLRYLKYVHGSMCSLCLSAGLSLVQLAGWVTTFQIPMNIKIAAITGIIVYSISIVS